MSSARIAIGHNQVPVNLENISPPLFKEYAGTEVLMTDYRDYVSRELDGDRQWITVGLPWVRWTFFRLSRAELALLETYEGPVSIRQLDQRDNVYRLFNGSAKSPEVGSNEAQFSHDALDGFADVTLDIFDLVVQP